MDKSLREQLDEIAQALRKISDDQIDSWTEQCDNLQQKMRYFGYTLGHGDEEARRELDRLDKSFGERIAEVWKKKYQRRL